MVNLNSNNNNNNNNHSSYENSIYSEELKSSCNSQQPKLISPHRQRAMSFLYCISKRLGRRVQHQLVVYNSQDDLRSSSTDSFSLSLDRGSSSDKHIHSSSIDLSSDGHSSRASSSSGSSRMSSCGNDENDLDDSSYRHERQHRRSYSPSACFRSVSVMNDRDNDNYNEHDDDDDDDNNRHSNAATEATNRSGYKFSARTPLKGLHLNRISISSVSRVLQHISSSSSSSTSMRSLSCNSTPLKRSKNEQKDKKTSASKKTESAKKAAKPQPQQQRILRQPINYVYLKGMSGLPTRRVPRSSLCCSYAYR